MKKENFLEKYDFYLLKIRWPVKGNYWIMISSIFAVLSLIASFITLIVFNVNLGFILPFVVAISVLNLFIGYPYILAERRFREIEEFYPEALRQMADILRAGGSYDYALKEISKAEYGSLQDEIIKVLRRLDEGQNIRSAMQALPENIHSNMVERSVNIIIDAIEAGAPLSEVLEDIANDAREMNRIRSERKSLTLMQVLFISTAAALIAPFVFGIVLSITGFLIDTGLRLASLAPAEKEAAFLFKDLLSNLFQAYIVIMIVFSSLIISVMSEGNISRSFIILPVLLLISFLLFFVSFLFIGKMAFGV